MGDNAKQRVLDHMTRAAVVALILGGSLAACANVEPFEYTAIHEIPEGPGLFSGADGEFELYGHD